MKEAHDNAAPACIDACVAVLRQALGLLEEVDDRLYASCDALPVRSGVGAHLRHCLDFYRRFLDGIPTGHVDYNRRGRDTLVERDRHFAATTVRIIIEELCTLRPADDARMLMVGLEGSALGEGDANYWCRSTVGRELQFLLSHTIHHYALIALLLKLRGFETDEEFGVNPSTLRHWRSQEQETEAASCSS